VRRRSFLGPGDRQAGPRGPPDPVRLKLEPYVNGVGARIRPRDSHCGSSDMAGRHVRARVHPPPRPELVRLQRRIVRARVLDGLVQSLNAVARGAFGQARRAAGPWR
jgi:hypothetical protein